MTTDTEHTIVLDVMGADSGKAEIIQGGLDAARQLDKLKVIFVGRQDDINEILQKEENLPANVEVRHADDEVPMTISATVGVRMRKSSISVGLKMVKEKEAVAFLSNPISPSNVLTSSGYLYSCFG